MNTYQQRGFVFLAAASLLPLAAFLIFTRLDVSWKTAIIAGGILAILSLLGAWVVAGILIQPMRQLVAQFEQLIREQPITPSALPEPLDRVWLGVETLLISQRTAREHLTQLVRERTAALESSREQLREANSLLEAVFEDNPNGLLVTAPDGHTLRASRACREILAVRDGIRLPRLEQFRSFDPKAFDRLLSEPGAQVEVETPTGRILICECIPLGVAAADTPNAIFARLWLMRDVSRQKRLERQLIQSQKMEAIGSLAGGIAHDFNNLLTVINGHLELIETESENFSPELSHHIALASDAGQMAARLVRQLLGFARNSVVTIRPVSANGVIRDTITMLGTTIPPQIEVELSLDDNLWLVSADDVQLTQVLMNLLLNARDAISDHGTITVRTYNAPPGTLHARQVEPPRETEVPHEAGSVIIEVADTGAGIPEHLRKHVFEPFFSTKNRERGSGMGLAMCYGIARQLNGWIDFHTEVDVGTRFIVCLPRDTAPQAPAPDVAARRKTQPIATIPAAQSKTIMIVDDEMDVRAVAASILRRSGYQIVEMANGIEALEYLRTHPSEVELILLDMNMPKLNGIETLRGMARLGCTMPVIICSGYITDTATLTAEYNGQTVDTLQKPFLLKNLVAAVNQRLNPENVPLGA
ncbi:MAG TPA: response regulator [Chthoniobacterales bacterium]